MVDEPEIRARFEMLAPFLNERTRRLAAAAEAAAIGRGGIARVSRATGVSRRAIASGLAQLKAPDDLDDGRIRRPGGGRKRTVETDATLRADLERLIDPVTRGDPESPLRWTCKSIRKLAEELRRMGHATSHRMVAELLHESGYSLQANRKTIEGKGHPDRNAQFEHINRKVRAALKAGEPVISVDAKKKELVGDFKNAGREWRPEGDPEPVRVYDFIIPRTRPGHALRDLRHGPQRGLGQRGDGPRHVGLRGGEHPAVVGLDGSSPLPRGQEAADHRRRRREQRVACPALEAGASAPRQRDGAADRGVPLPAGDEQVEQDRAPALLVHQPELARQAAGEPRGGRQPDRGDDDRDGFEGRLRAGPQLVPIGDQGLEEGHGGDQA